MQRPQVAASLTESEADEFASKAIKAHCQAILVADPKSVQFDGYIKQLGEWELVMTSLASECSRLSRLSYEPLHTMLLESVGLVSKWLSLGESIFQAKVGSVLLAPVQARAKLFYLSLSPSLYAFWGDLAASTSRQLVRCSILLLNGVVCWAS